MLDRGFPQEDGQVTLRKLPEIREGMMILNNMILLSDIQGSSSEKKEKNEFHVLAKKSCINVKKSLKPSISLINTMRTVN